MVGSFTLQPVLELARSRLEAATMQLQKLGAQRQEAEAKLRQLQGARAQYQTNRQRELLQGMEPDRLRDFDAFLARLEGAIELQAAQVERASHAWEAEHRRWLELRTREQALGVLERRHAAMRAQREARSEQKQQDAFAAETTRQGREG
jgi:flagellar FliJ protein